MHAYTRFSFFTLLALIMANPLQGAAPKWAEAGRLINLSQAVDYTANFTAEVDGVRAHLFSVEALDCVLERFDVWGLRIYHGQHDGAPALVVVGVDGAGEDLLAEPIMDLSAPCPSTCNGETPDWAQAGQRITLEQAQTMTEQFTWEVSGVRAHVFSTPAMRKVMDQDGVRGVRMYHGTNTQDKAVLVLVGVDARGRDKRDGNLVEMGVPCPPHCDQDVAMEAADPGETAIPTEDDLPR